MGCVILPLPRNLPGNFLFLRHRRLFLFRRLLCLLLFIPTLLLSRFLDSVLFRIVALDQDARDVALAVLGFANADEVFQVVIPEDADQVIPYPRAVIGAESAVLEVAPADNLPSYNLA